MEVFTETTIRFLQKYLGVLDNTVPEWINLNDSFVGNESFNLKISLICFFNLIPKCVSPVKAFTVRFGFIIPRIVMRSGQVDFVAEIPTKP